MNLDLTWKQSFLIIEWTGCNGKESYKLQVNKCKLQVEKVYYFGHSLPFTQGTLSGKKDDDVKVINILFYKIG